MRAPGGPAGGGSGTRPWNPLPPSRPGTGEAGRLPWQVLTTSAVPPLQLRGRPCGGLGRGGRAAGAPSRATWGAFSSPPPSSTLLVRARPSDPAEVRRGWAGGPGRGGGHAAGRDPTEAGATGQGAGPSEARSGTPTAPHPRDRALRSGAPGWPCGGRGPGVGGRPWLPAQPDPGAAPPPSRLECPRRLGCREPENPRPSSPAGRFIYSLSPCHRARYSPRRGGPPGSCEVCSDNWDRPPGMHRLRVPAGSLAGSLRVGRPEMPAQSWPQGHGCGFEELVALR